MPTRTPRPGHSLIETVVVLGILALLIGLMLPAVQNVRRKALEMGCKNNLYQVNLATSSYVELNRKLPTVALPGRIGGWTVEILPFVEQGNLHRTLRVGQPLTAAPAIAQRVPRVYICPVRESLDMEPLVIDRTHYVLIPNNRQRDTYWLRDAPVDLHHPWLNGPELQPGDFRNRPGPHQGRYFGSHGGQQGVGTVEG
jgi:type II secretory pathway pseudopilin PulG